MLLDGTVLIVGGNVGAAMTAERYTPQTNTWASAGSPATGLYRFTTTLLLSGEVLLVGGTGVGNKPDDSTISFAPNTNEWRRSGSLSRARTGHAAVLVNGHVLVIGGEGTAAASSAERYDATPLGTTCYGATGRCVGGAFLTRWQQHGQLPINGYPLGNPFPEQLGDGTIHLVQYFERVRMEAHPKNAAPNDVLLGQFGRALHPADPAVPSRAGARYFEQTGHNLDADFLAYWQANGELSQFGFPLTEVFTETLEDGKPYRVQYFERARFESHPENAAPYNVLLGQFGRRILAGR